MSWIKSKSVGMLPQIIQNGGIVLAFSLLELIGALGGFACYKQIAIDLRPFGSRYRRVMSGTCFSRSTASSICSAPPALSGVTVSSGYETYRMESRFADIVSPAEAGSSLYK